MIRSGPIQTGKTKAKERKELEKRISSGEVNIVIGTHVTLF